MKNITYKLRGKVWLYPGKGGWHFITLPKKHSAIIKKTSGLLKRRWGSLPVTATIGKTSWKTSIFSDAKRNAYLLPVKADVRKKEKIDPGMTVLFSIKVEMM